MPYEKQFLNVFDRAMAYIETGQGDPIVFLHGNPTSSYLWRNILPYLQGEGRCIAPDLIGMGDSEKLPASGPGSYTFIEHRRYLDALLAELRVERNVTFVTHDWVRTGSPGKGGVRPSPGRGSCPSQASPLMWWRSWAPSPHGWRRVPFPSSSSLRSRGPFRRTSACSAEAFPIRLG